MPNSIAKSTDAKQHRLPERSAEMAKADLRKPEMGTESGGSRATVGRVIRVILREMEWSLKELAWALKRDERQIARWISGAERPQFDVIYSVVALRRPLVVAWAEVVGDRVEVETVIRVRRPA